MRTVLRFSSHSFVDLITNSSSELFVCNSRKSIEAFKQLIEELAAGVCGERTITTEELFTTIFHEPEVCRLAFDLSRYPKRDEFESFNSYDQYQRNPIYINCRAAVNAFQAANPRPTGDKQVAKWFAKVRDLEKPFDEKQRETEMAMYRWAFKANGLPWTFKEGADYKENESFWEQAGPIRTAVSYGYKLKKGQILLLSAGDNSVPWELMEKIESSVPCQRFHLG
jgi:hypothetical protein